jgi:hypothetical protein
MARDDQIAAIVDVGRRTRKPTPRWLWITAGIVGVICTTGFAVAMLGGHGPGEPADPPVARRETSGGGLGTGLVIGAGGGVAIGFALARHRRDHSSRSRP